MKNFITIEGCDGVGKTFQTNLLKQYCAQNGYDVVFTREPGGSEIAEKIRNIILDVKNQGMDDLCEAFLYASARIQHLKDIVKPAVKNEATGYRFYEREQLVIIQMIKNLKDMLWNALQKEVAVEEPVTVLFPGDDNEKTIE